MMMMMKTRKLMIQLSPHLLSSILDLRYISEMVQDRR